MPTVALQRVVDAAAADVLRVVENPLGIAFSGPLLMVQTDAGAAGSLWVAGTESGDPLFRSRMEERDVERYGFSSGYSDRRTFAGGDYGGRYNDNPYRPGHCGDWTCLCQCRPDS